METTGFFVINLDRSQDRLQAIAANLQSVGLEFERVVAIDGSKLDLTALNSADVDLRTWYNLHHRAPKANEVACYLSHMKALERFLASDYAYGVIFEDDATVDGSFPQVIEKLQACAAKWEIVKLFVSHPGQQILRTKLTDQHDLTSLVTQSGSAACYMLTKPAAARLLPFLRPVRLPYDHIFDRNFGHGLKLRAVNPAPVARTGVPSTIGYKRNKGAGKQTFLLPASWGDRPLYHRWRVPFYRTLVEFRRVAYNLFMDDGLKVLFKKGLSRS